VIVTAKSGFASASRTTATTGFASESATKLRNCGEPAMKRSERTSTMSVTSSRESSRKLCAISFAARVDSGLPVTCASVVRPWRRIAIAANASTTTPVQAR
jgi:hypothetical protein